MKKVIRLTESDLKKIVENILNNSESNVSDIVHKHVDSFVNETIDRFLDIMQEMSKDLATSAKVNTNFNFAEAEIHFEKEMLNLSEEIIHKIHEDEELVKHISNIEHNNEH